MFEKAEKLSAWPKRGPLLAFARAGPRATSAATTTRDLALLGGGSARLEQCETTTSSAEQSGQRKPGGVTSELGRGRRSLNRAQVARAQDVRGLAVGCGGDAFHEAAQLVGVGSSGTS